MAKKEGEILESSTGVECLAIEFVILVTGSLFRGDRGLLDGALEKILGHKQ
jgi:hypothetical protein